jgi:3-hydroxyacyl-CoA dehydrogenase
VADTPKPIDDAVRWGFMHEAGPFETWDMLGVWKPWANESRRAIPAAEWVTRCSQAGFESFYQ